MTELSRYIAGYRLRGQVTALFVGRRRRASPAVCLRWLPVWLPRNLISFANRLIRHVADWSGEAVVRSSTGPASPATVTSARPAAVTAPHSAGRARPRSPLAAGLLPLRHQRCPYLRLLCCRCTFKLSKLSEIRSEQHGVPWAENSTIARILTSKVVDIRLLRP